MKSARWLVLTAMLGSASALAEQSHTLRQGAHDLTFHYGVVPAAVVLAHADEHPERAMHGGKPGAASSHIVVALFDSASGERVSDAEVTATVTPLGRSSVTKKLERMNIAEQPSFGEFFPLSAPGIYRIRFEARRPGASAPAVAEFEHRIAPEGRR
jgi:hypothetical protein